MTRIQKLVVVESALVLLALVMFVVGLATLFSSPESLLGLRFTFAGWLCLGGRLALCWRYPEIQAWWKGQRK